MCVLPLSVLIIAIYFDLEVVHLCSLHFSSRDHANDIVAICILCGLCESLLAVFISNLIVIVLF